ncbi:integral membrane sensor signal transduction histidine kinase [Calothrix parasitica NIES-267]|uniref:histidine kinase n=1 Tax=Calothrix parasitica NIES-267 TaxID=1973488 RepID=A0A1Z4LSM4_9CYAN|nr:integral membrane sensor signal transduction histidine kinase [Calothrix parasitica NIES-267]
MNNRAVSIPKVIRYVEWVILVVLFFIILFIISLPIDAPTEYPQPLIPHNFVFGSLLICAFLSFIFPINRPLWQRRVYIFVEIISILPCHLMGWDLNLLLFLYIAKSCFLLNRRLDVIVTATATCLSAVALDTFSFIYRFEAMRNYWISHADKLLTLERMIPANVVPSLGIYFISCVFVIMFCYLAIAEQKSRKKAEKLAQEVEALASKLERHRIARDIHDSLGHTLTTLDVQLELANTLANRQPENALQALNICKQLSSQCLVEVRRAVRTMRDSTFDLNEALQTLVAQVRQNRSLDISMEMKLPNLPLQTAHQLYCIAKEGLTNIQKHADASQVTLKGETNFNNIVLEIIDNGKGFNPDSPHAGFGLKGMQERVDVLAGEMRIKSQKAKGTCIQVFIPFLF